MNLKTIRHYKIELLLKINSVIKNIDDAEELCLIFNTA